MLVALMGLGLTAVVSVEATASQRAKERELMSIGRQYRNAIGRYYESQLTGRGREYPTSLDDLLKDNRVPGVRRHLRKVFVDPMTGKQEWGFVLVGGRIAGVHSLSEGQPIKQAGFEAEELGFTGKGKLSEWVFTYPSDLMLRADSNGSAPAAPNLPELPAMRPGDKP